MKRKKMRQILEDATYILIAALTGAFIALIILRLTGVIGNA
jgi:hypothetical protein